MNYTEFVNAVKEKLTQELNGGVRVNVYTTKKNNATERTGLILETPGVNISPTIYLEEFFELYEKGKQMDWIIEDNLSHSRPGSTDIFCLPLLFFAA